MDRIFTRLGASDNILAGQSTFMLELQETSSIFVLPLPLPPSLMMFLLFILLPRPRPPLPCYPSSFVLY